MLRARSEEEYSHLNEDGLPKRGTRLRDGDVVIGAVLEKKRSAYGTKAPPIEKSSTTRIVRGEETIVFGSEHLRDATRDTAHVYCRQPLTLEKGSKIASQHGQKGVVCATLPQRDMPFLSDGTVPDMVMDPHGLHSRMTLGHMMEMVVSKLGGMQGRTVDATSFVHDTLLELSEMSGIPPDVVAGMRGDEDVWNVDVVGIMLQKMGMSKWGTDVMISGTTGEIIRDPRGREAQIFFAPCFYQILKQVPSVKHHVCTRGRINAITRQPAEGRANKGGQRVGIMESNAMEGWGAAYVIADRQRDCADRTTVAFCEHDGIIAEPRTRSFGVLNASEMRKRKRETFPAHCRICNSETSVVGVTTRHSLRVVAQELYSAGLALRASISKESIAL